MNKPLETKYLLDTNTCIRYLKGKSSQISEKIEMLSDENIMVCSVVKAELFYGAAKSNRPEQTLADQQLFLNRFESLPFDDAATIIAALEKRGTLVGPNDMFIASIALANNLTLVTHNVVEFSRINGLKIEDWET